MDHCAARPRVRRSGLTQASRRQHDRLDQPRHIPLHARLHQPPEHRQHRRFVRFALTERPVRGPPRRAVSSPTGRRGWELAGFVQDHVRLWRRFTIEGGIRYSLDPPVTEANNRMVNFNYSRTTPGLNQFAGQAGVNDYGGISFNKLTIAPRFAIAWDVSKDGSTVLRIAFSKDYDPGAYMAEGILARNPPYEADWICSMVLSSSIPV